MSHTVIEELPADDAASQDFDTVLGDVLVAKDADPQAFLEEVFFFLKRRTNFFKEPGADKRALEAVHKIMRKAPAVHTHSAVKAGFLNTASTKAAKDEKPVESIEVIRSVQLVAPSVL